MGGNFRALHIDGNSICLSQESSDASLRTLFSDLRSMIKFLRTQLPPSVTAPLSGLLMPSLVSRLISNWFSSAVPMDLNGMEEFQGTVDLVLEFAKDLDTYQWPGRDDLLAWTKGIPRVWLEKRRETSLDSIRKLLVKGLGKIKTVERVETQVLSHEDSVLTVGGGHDDWNAEWSDEESKDSPKRTVDHVGDHGEEEDVSAWGLDDDTHDQNNHEAPKHTNATDEDADAWGWGDDAEDVQPPNPSQPALQSPSKSKSNGHRGAPSHNEREVTLKETYNITSIPSEVLDIIKQVMSDAETLTTPK